MEEKLPVISVRESLTVQSFDLAILVERYLSAVDVAPSTKDTYRKSLRRFLGWRAERAIDNLTREDVLAYKQYLLANIEASTAGTYLTALRGFLAWLEFEQIYPNVAANVKGVKLSKSHRKDALTPKQAMSVLETLKGDTLQDKRDYALLNLLIRTGLRTIEVSRANISDIRNKGAQTVLYVQGKGRLSKDEFVVLTDATLLPIYSYLAGRRASDSEMVQPNSPLFASLSTRTYGQRLATRSLREIAKKALRKAGLDNPRLSAHSLRHTAVTLALIGGASIQQAQALARHNSISTTTIYAHNIDRVNQAPERFIDEMLDNL